MFVRAIYLILSNMGENEVNFQKTLGVDDES